MLRISVIAGLVLGTAALFLCTSMGTVAQAANNSEQIVFSDNGSGFGNFAGTNTPFGFWIWCEGDSRNPYQGACNGSMYFYALGITKHVSGSVIETAADTYQMSVVSTVDDSVSCTLTNSPPITKRRTNTVTVSCTAPSGGGADSKALVNVTGPS